MSASLPTGPEWLLNHTYLFFLCFAIMWCVTSFLISAYSGWLTLAGKFRCIGKFDGETWPFCSAYLRFYCHYGSCLNVGTDSSGLYLSVFPIFRAGHPPLLIPWSEATVVRGETGIFFFKRRKLLLGREESIPLSISSALAERLQRAAGQAWPIESLAA